ncbi:hypothetical protein [Runella sp. SP2]|uniref:hypothetical protein n=1 Tax=Runella sp. SP2 TaxID=2268026 RepID=UPI000F076407|nr:hypothetical protein [Runella sp. SP2]AYQ31451.1 hypothetical protein DTQ70_04305 [Runella sp. SP2]
MEALETFVEGAYVRLSFDVAGLTVGTSLQGKLLFKGQTYQLFNELNGTILSMSSATNTLVSGTYKFVLLWYNQDTNEPFEEEEYEIIIKPRK